MRPESRPAIIPPAIPGPAVEQLSLGHICFHGEFEYFERPDAWQGQAQVYRAKIADVIMTDGYRSGRWECSRVHFDRFREVILPPLPTPAPVAEVEVKVKSASPSPVPAPLSGSSRTPICYGQINQGTWCQEWYETSTRDAGLRARALRKLGYACRSSAMGSQVTGVGVVKMTLLDIRPGANPDTANLPKVRVERIWGDR